MWFYRKSNKVISKVINDSYSDVQAVNSKYVIMRDSRPLAGFTNITLQYINITLNFLQWPK